MCACTCVSAFERERVRGRGLKQPLLCLQEQGLATEERREGRRLCLELSKCGSSGPQSLYQCHSSIFFFFFLWFFSPIYLPGDYSPHPQCRKNTCSLTMDGSTQSPALYSPPAILLMLSIHSNRTLSKCCFFFFFPSLSHVCRSAEC